MCIYVDDNYDILIKVKLNESKIFNLRFKEIFLHQFSLKLKIRLFFSLAIQNSKYKINTRLFSFFAINYRNLHQKIKYAV